MPLLRKTWKFSLEDCLHVDNGTSLKDCLHVGPNLTPLLFDILFRFRENNIAILGDIEKVFLNVGFHATDRDCLRFLWVENQFETCCLSIWIEMSSIDGKPAEVLPVNENGKRIEKRQYLVEIATKIVDEFLLRAFKVNELIKKKENLESLQIGVSKNAHTRLKH